MQIFHSSHFSDSIDLEAYIQVEEVKNSQGLVLFRFVRFNLDKSVITKILQARATGQRLYISRNLLAQLRYYALSDGENHHRENRFQSGLTFCTYYPPRPPRSPDQPPPRSPAQPGNENSGLLPRLTGEEPENIVMRSTISLSGDIIHQLRRDCLERPKRCLAIARAHYWLINQLLNQLRIKATRWLNWLAWALSLSIVALVVILNAEYLMPIDSLKLLAPAASAWLLQQGIKRLLRFLWPFVRRWAWRQFLLRFLSPKPLEKKIAQVLLRRVVP